MPREIIHIDMDAFFASIEQQRHPEYEGKPLVVGGMPGKRGVVSAASYEARKYGIRSGMPIRQAKKRCPQAIFLPVDMKKYQEVSEQLMEILKDYSPLLEPVSLDEAFLDVTEHKGNFKTPEEIAKDIKRRIREELGLTASVGIGPNKLIAKLASDMNKPDGLTIIRPEKVSEVLENLPVAKLWGIGKKTEGKLKEMGIQTIGELRQTPKEFLRRQFGKSYGEMLYRISRGIDESPVTLPGEPKSISHETTFEKDIKNMELLERALLDLSEAVAKRLKDHQFRFRTVTLKLRFSDFQTITRNYTFQYPQSSKQSLFEAAWELLTKNLSPKKKVRLIGVGVSNLIKEETAQLELF